MANNFLFSVIIPVYNVEDYLEECLLSVINQSIGFKDNIQIILINDASPDGSYKICEKYKDMYPENITYITQENTGVSGARNHGLKYVQGKYVNFIDSDDKWELDVFKKVYDFFEKHYNETDVVTTGIQFFEAIDRAHKINLRLEKGSRVADLTNPEEYTSVVVQVASSFFKAAAIKDLKFVENLKLGEDSMFVNSLILRRMTVGFVDNTTYYYRRRFAETSAVQTLKFSDHFYFDRLQNYHLALIELCKKTLGYLAPYIKNVVYYDFAWHLYHPAYKFLSKEKYSLFLNLCKEVLSHIDDDVILKCPYHIPVIKKLTALRLKHGKDYNFYDKCTFDPEERCIRLNDNLLTHIAKNPHICKITYCRVDNNTLTLEGLMSNFVFQLEGGEMLPYFKVGKRVIKTTFEDCDYRLKDTCIDAQPYYKKFKIKVSLAKNKGEKIIYVRPYLKFANGRTRVGMSYSEFVQTSIDFPKNYSIEGNYLLESSKTSIKITPLKNVIKKAFTLISKEWALYWDLVSLKKKEFALLRLQALFYKLLHRKKELWLIFDRAENAADNGEAFFKHVSLNKPKGVRPIFAISQNAACVNRLKNSGEVVFLEDKKFLLYFLVANKIISSNASSFSMNPFGDDSVHFADLFRYKYYYLQHGVTLYDLSDFLNKYSNNIYKIFCTSEKEACEFWNNNYCYLPEQVSVTGQARFDNLESASEKLIAILPTWRKAIGEGNLNQYLEGFKNTEFFAFYNKLINDKRLLDAMGQKGYKGLLCLHPIHSKQSVDFQENDIFSVNKGYTNYTDVFKKAALTVTDYSSVAFDFAYLKKPIIYAQFDKDEFYKNHPYKNCNFDYEQEGFGEVMYDYESTVSALITAIENDCAPKAEYTHRADKYFLYNDKQNCHRILEEILNS